MFERDKKIPQKSTLPRSSLSDSKYQLRLDDSTHSLFSAPARDVAVEESEEKKIPPAPEYQDFSSIPVSQEATLIPENKLIKAEETEEQKQTLPDSRYMHPIDKATAPGEIQDLNQDLAPKFYMDPKDLRKHVQQELFIEATAQGLLGGYGRAHEWGVVIFEIDADGQKVYSFTPPYVGREGEMEIDQDEMLKKAAQTAEKLADKSVFGTTNLHEHVHTHPSGIRARNKYRPEEFSSEDKDVGIEGKKDSVLPNVGLVTPSGGYDIIGEKTQGKVETTLKRNDKKRGHRPDYVPNIPDIGGAIRSRIDYIVNAQRTQLRAELEQATRFRRPFIVGKLQQLERRYQRALKRLARKVDKLLDLQGEQNKRAAKK